MTRFYYLEQGVDYVVQYLNIMKGGEVPAKIKSTKIIDLTKAIGRDF